MPTAFVLPNYTEELEIIEVADAMELAYWSEEASDLVYGRDGAQN